MTTQQKPRIYTKAVSQQLRNAIPQKIKDKRFWSQHRLTLYALFQLQQDQQSLPQEKHEPLWYVEGMVAFPDKRTREARGWIERGDNERIDVMHAILEDTDWVYFPAARYLVTSPLTIEEIESVPLPLVRECENEIGTYPKPHYQEAHNLALVRAYAENEEQYFQARASQLLMVSPDLLIDALIDKNARVLNYLPLPQSSQVQTLRADPEWHGKDLNWNLDR